MVPCQRWRTTRRCRIHRNHVTRLLLLSMERPRHEQFLRRTYHGEFFQSMLSFLYGQSTRALSRCCSRFKSLPPSNCSRTILSLFLSPSLYAMISLSPFLSPAETLSFASKNKKPWKECHVRFFLKRIIRTSRDVSFFFFSSFFLLFFSFIVTRARYLWRVKQYIDVEM